MSYCTVADLRAEGFDAESYSDEDLENRINLSCEFIDRITKSFFDIREKNILLDGRGGHILLLPFCLIEAEFIKIDGEIITDYVNYKNNSYPKIYREKKWTKGIQNIEISGTFGYSEIPEAIKRASMKLAMNYFDLLSNSEAQEEKNLRGLLISESTDGHSYSLSSSSVSNLITGDTEIDQILKQFSKPGFKISAV